ncbi:MAG: PhnD/SsuA/transferrin family substrate-binding protein [Chloroflexia bacterium]
MNDQPLRFATFLAPGIYPVYEFIAQYVGQRLGRPAQLAVGRSYDEFEDGRTDLGFICGLPYVMLARREPPPVEPLAAPVLQGERYGGKPVYYSDIIVRRSSPFKSFEDLRGARWAYNEEDSQSGYGITRDRLLQMGETSGYFGQAVPSGFHQESIQMVCSAQVDASAIDSQVLAVAFRDDPGLVLQLRVIDTLGPSTIQPVVAASRLSAKLKAEIRSALLGMADDPSARERLAEAFIDRFVPVTDADYEGIRKQLAAAEEAGFFELK